MKKVHLTLFLSFFYGAAAFAQISNPAPYCAAGYDGGGFGALLHYISNVTLGTLTNTTAATMPAIPGYFYFNAVPAPALTKGNTYTLSVTHDPQPSTIHFVAVYIDFNHNNSFADAGERVLQQKTTAVVNPSVATVTIPANAVTGTTRMRVMVFEDDQYTAASANATPCTADATGSLDWGETEDYDVNITASTTGISEINHTKALTLYPNPAKDYFLAADASAGAEMKIINMAGKVVQAFTVSDKRIDISSLAPGLYYVSIIKDGSCSDSMLSVEK